MPFLSPAKILVILVVALIVLGPDKLPKVAKQIGGLWGDFRKFRHRFESDVRGSFPDLPSSEKIAQAVRSPISFLDELADAHVRNGAAPPANGAVHVPSEDGPLEVVGDETERTEPGRGDGRSEPRGTEESREVNGMIAHPGPVVHQVRPTGGVVPDDPGLN